MLAFPAPAGDRQQVAVLRVAPPAARTASGVADTVRVSAAALRRAARDADRPTGRSILAAARTLRSTATLFEWVVGQRNHGADRRRTASAALAQMIATSEEFHALYRASQRQRAELGRSERRLDRLAREALRAQDLERARIAHQIHDTAAQSMVSAYRFLDAARASGKPASGTREAADHLAFAAERLRTAIGEVRAVLASLLPPGLEELGVAHATGRRVGELTAGTAVTGHVTGDLPRLEGWVEQAFYGMAVEAVSNAIRHGSPSTVRVEFAANRGRAVATIRDDGAGFDVPATVKRSGERGHGEGLGLLGMTRQASWLGGRASIRSAPGAGTTIRISVPLERYRRIPEPEAEQVEDGTATADGVLRGIDRKKGDAPTLPSGAVSRGSGRAAGRADRVRRRRAC